MAHDLLQARSYSRRWVAESEWSFICIHSCSPSLTLPAELPLLSDQWRHNKYNALESSWNLPPLPQPSWSVEKLPSVKLGPGVMLEHFPKHLIIDPFIAEYPISIPLSSCSVKCCPEEKQAFKCYYSLKYSECLLWANHQAKQKACNW